MRIFLSGGNGYVGRTLCRVLAPRHEVCVVDNLRYGQRMDPHELSNIRFEQADIRDRRAMEAIVQDFRPDAMVHLAAIHFIPECESDPELAVSTNVVGTANLASVCPADCRFVFASSGAVYAPEGSPHRELESTLFPSDVYGWTKLQGEQFVQYFAAQRSFPACIVRLFNVIGPGETNPHVLPEIVAQLKADRRVLKLGNLDAKRDYVHVADVARGFAAVACTGSLPLGASIVNLGTQQAYSVHELLQHLKSISGIDFRVEADPARMRASDRPFLAADNSRIREQFAWKPQFAIADALADLWDAPDLPPAWIERYR